MFLREGLAEVWVPCEEIKLGPGTKRAGFYNRDQVTNRDVTMAVLQILKPRLYLDGFGGTGIRGIRVAREVGTHPVISEINKSSFDLINENVKKNEVDIEVYNESFESIASKYMFDFIDVDPYGSVVPFLDVALSHVRNGGYLGITATDLSALTGSAPMKTRRRYNAFIVNDRLRHESGIRLLMSYVAGRAAALDRYIIPILSFWKSHYYRIIVRVKNGTGEADKMLENIGQTNKYSELSPIYRDIPEGPMWKSVLNSVEVVQAIAARSFEYLDNNSVELMNRLGDEDKMFLFYELTDFASHFKRNLPKLEELMSEMSAETGEKVFRTHFSPTAVKAPVDSTKFQEIFLAISKK